MNLQPWASKGNILHELIQPGKYMNTFCFIRWPRSRLHGHFHSVPTLKFRRLEATDGQTKTSMTVPLSRKTLLIISKGQSPSPYQLYTNGQGEENNRRTNKVQFITVPVLQTKTWTIRHLFVACLGGGAWHDGFPVLDLVLTFCIIHNVSQQVCKEIWELLYRLWVTMHPWQANL